MTRTCKLLFVPVFLLQAGFFWFVSQHRFIDGDEGFYLLASRLVLQHKTPYLDFFYTQAPLLPYLYALWLRLAGISWFSARAFCALLTAVIGGLMYEYVCHETGRWVAGVGAVVLFASNNLAMAWFPIVKTFAPAVLFLFLVYVILTRVSPTSRGWMFLIAGILFGLSVDTRSYIVAIFPVFLWWMVRSKQTRRVVRLLWFSSGFILGIVPSLVLLFASPDAYMFNNLGYHAMRSGAGLIANWDNKFLVVKALFTGPFTGIQISMLVLTCIGLMFLFRIRRDSSALALLLVLALSLVSLLPSPTMPQYFCVIVPFLIVAAVCFISDCFAKLQSARARRAARALCIVLLMCFIGLGCATFERYLFTGYGVPGLRNPADAPNWTLTQVTAVSKAIDELTWPGEQVVSIWPGYIFASQANPYPGFENNFGVGVAEKFSPERRRKYNLVSDADINSAFAHHRPRIAVAGNQGPWNGAPEYATSVSMLRGFGYSLARKVGDTSIYKCCAEQ